MLIAFSLSQKMRVIQILYEGMLTHFERIEDGLAWYHAAALLNIKGCEILWSLKVKNRVAGQCVT